MTSPPASATLTPVPLLTPLPSLARLARFTLVPLALTACSPTKEAERPAGEGPIRETKALAPTPRTPKTPGVKENEKESAATSTPGNERITCGKEIILHGQGYDQKARDCLFQAYERGDEAQLTTTSYTVEGDPITHAIVVLSRDRIQVHRDSADRFGQPGQLDFTCKSLAREPTEDGRDQFVLRGCVGGPSETLTIR